MAPSTGILAVMCVVASSLVGGCSSASNEDWLRAADRSCQSADHDLDKLVAPTSLAEVDAYSRAVRDRIEALRAEVKTDGDSSSAHKALDRYLVEQQAVADSLTAAAVDGDAAKVQELLSDAASDLAASGGRMAKEFGFQSCGVSKASG